MMKRKMTTVLSLMLVTAMTLSASNGVTNVQAAQKEDALARYTVVVNQKDSHVQLPLMVSLRKMAKATGMKVTRNGKHIRLDTGEMHADFTIGKDEYSLTTSIAGACGATGPFSLGEAPYIVKKNIYVPLSLFWVIEGNDSSVISVSGQEILFSTNK